jgi:2'-5' RNA ligase
MLGEALGTTVAAEVARSLRVRADTARREGLRLHTGQDLHLTLFFLGGVGAGTEPELAELLEANLEGLRAPQMTLTSGGAFPRRGSERILWVGVDGACARLRELHERVGEACVAAGFEADARPWRPHVTVGRLRRRLDGGPARVAEGFYELKFGHEWKPLGVSLVESVPGGGPPAYEARRTFELAAD